MRLMKKRRNVCADNDVYMPMSTVTMEITERDAA